MVAADIRERTSILAVVRGRFSVLFWFLVAVIAVPVVFPDGPVIRKVMGVSLFVLMLSGLRAVSDQQRHFVIGLVLCVPAVVLNVAGLATENFWMYQVSQYLYLAFFVFLAVKMLRWTMKQREVDPETIYAAVSVYLLMALIWAVAYYTIALIAPGSFHFPDGDALGQVQSARMEALDASGELEPTPDWTTIAESVQGTMMYYSVVTLTTLGYGDIHPVGDAARILGMLEATLGQLYLVILVARLVGLYTAQDAERRRKETPT